MRKDKGMDADLHKMNANQLYQALSAKFNAKGIRAKETTESEKLMLTASVNSKLTKIP